LGLLAGWGALVMVGALIVSIVLHEAGHYFAARASGMKVTEFFVGMGPRLWSFRRGETEYGVKAFPVGAYVRIIGMNNLEPVDPTDEDRAYRSKGTFRRLAVVLAGPATNLLLAFFLLYALVATAGRPDASAWTVGDVVAGSAADGAGVVAGDRIVAIDGVGVETFSGLKEVIAGSSDDEVVLAFEREGELLEATVPLTFTLSASGAAAIPSDPVLPEDTRVVSVDDVPVRSFTELREALAGGTGEAELMVEVHRQEYRLPATLPIQLPADGGKGFLGVAQEVPLVEPGVVQSVPETVGYYGETVGVIFSGLGQLFSPEGLSNYAGIVADSATPGDPEPAGGPAPALVPVSSGPELVEAPAAERPLSIIGIVQIGSALGQWQEVVFLLAMVNLFLGLLNLLPLLPFDGGHAVVAAYEGIRGAIARRPYRVDIAKLMPITYVVVVLLLGFGLTAVWLDITDPIQLP
jgi:RIP metalloprotease RseP